jgi:hypothetical protein
MPRLELVRPFTLPETAALDGLDAAALVAIAERAAALHAGAMARLALVGTTPSSVPPSADEHMTAEQVAQRLNAEPSWVYRHARQLGAVKLDGILRFPHRRLEAYLARQARLG